MKIYTLSVCMAMLNLTAGLAQKSIDVRLINNYYDPSTQELYVDVDIHYTGVGEMSIADQNYRFYFDSENLQLDAEDSRTDLPSDMYGPIQFQEILEGIHVENINELNFDDNLGFVNFSIDLQDDLNGGIILDKSSGWTRIAVLKFNVKNDLDVSQIVWSQKGLTDAYASAYVEVMEWVSPNHTEPVIIDSYTNLNYRKNENSENADIFIGPNPAVDFIRVKMNEGFESAIDLSIIDNAGRIVRKQTIPVGEDQVIMDIGDLVASNYTVEIFDLQNHNRVYAQKLILTD